MEMEARKKGRKGIKQIKGEVLANNQELEQLSIKESIKTLGICVNLTITWDKLFKIMKEKLVQAITYLRNTLMNTYNACMYYNIYIFDKEGLFRI